VCTILATLGGEERKVGMLWFAVDPKRPRPVAWVYDFLVEPEYRRRGYGRAAFLAMEDKVRALGLSRIELHVFGHNHAARVLYESLGYEVTNLNLAKQVA
jgi:GNAT superfamily N-acetyltransferase